jgi:hypothetical protein
MPPVYRSFVYAAQNNSKLLLYKNIATSTISKLMESLLRWNNEHLQKLGRLDRMGRSGST